MSWAEYLKDNITTAKELANLLHLSEQEEKSMAAILEKYPMSVTHYYLSLINFEDEDDPIRKMCIPAIGEEDESGSLDTSGEKENTVLEGMQHKYPQTAMILSTNQCAMYCRHCFRKRLVGMSDEEVASQIHPVIDYIRGHKEINNALLSGGDAFLNTTSVIEEYLRELTAIEHLHMIRFGTRVPVVFPQRITEDRELLEVLKRYGKKKQIYVVTHFNHPRELTKEALAAIEGLKEAGIVIRNQTVLLKGVNDNPDILAELLQKLTKHGINPYYVFQCRPVAGVKNQFQVPLQKAYRIVQEAKNRQNGHGKSFRFVFSHPTGKIEIIGVLPDGRMIFQYHQAKYPENRGKILIRDIKEDQTWLEEDL
ncbi:MAG: KamA family radical SAM protein [Epulopiscium sp.]|jgi:lysine 2,3-aminomutase|nr:KamA family radical SAM protein [Candidatus Epulonipiscium sp.]